MVALAFSVFAVALTLVVFRPGVRSLRSAASDLQHRFDTVTEKVTEREEAAR
jgi:hypothetical protein